MRRGTPAAKLRAAMAAPLPPAVPRAAPAQSAAGRRLNCDLLAAFLRAPQSSTKHGDADDEKRPYGSAAPLDDTADAALSGVFNSDAKFSFYSHSSGLVQGNTLGAPAELAERMGSEPFWLNVYNAQEHDVRILAKV